MFSKDAIGYGRAKGIRSMCKRLCHVGIMLSPELTCHCLGELIM
jgi:hypothetical protein